MVICFNTHDAPVLLQNCSRWVLHVPQQPARMTIAMHASILALASQYEEKAQLAQHPGCRVCSMCGQLVLDCGDSLAVWLLTCIIMHSWCRKQNEAFVLTSNGHNPTRPLPARPTPVLLNLTALPKLSLQLSCPRLSLRQCLIPWRKNLIPPIQQLSYWASSLHSGCYRKLK